MDSTPYNQPPSNLDSPGYFVWEPAGKNIAIHLSGEVVDHLNYAVMRGFGAVPKRGAEVGGLLLGTVKRGAKSVVRIEEFVNIPCEHLYGPSYILSESDLLALDRELSARAASSIGDTHVVGFFRSNTRELLQLSEVELALLDARCPDDEAVCLLVRPFATRPSDAVFLTREDGRFSGGVRNDTFIFRRKEMNLGPTPRRQRAAVFPDAPPSASAVSETWEVAPRSADNPRPEFPAPVPGVTGAQIADFNNSRPRRGRYGRGPRPEVATGKTGSHAADPGADSPSQDAAIPSETPWDVRLAPVKRSQSAWAPLSFIFLLLGILIGAGVTLTMNRAHGVAPNEDPYALNLGVSHFGESFHLAWNPQMPVLRQARGGELIIQEGETKKTQPLSADDLARGGLLYRGASEPVRFTLTLFLRDRAAFSETVEHLPPQ